jgi:hypothetical protein
MRTSTFLAGVAVAALALGGCADEAAESEADTATEADGVATPEPSAEPEPEVFRESMGLFRTTDPATAELAELLETGLVALDLTLHVTDEVVETTEPVDGAAGSIDVRFFFDGDEDGFLTLNVPEAALTFGDFEEQDALSTLRGVFAVEASSDSDADYVLTLTGDVPETDTGDEERCNSEGLEDELLADVDTLMDDPGAYTAVRERWSDSPRLWWGLKATAHSLAEYGNVSDSVATACAVYY